MTGDAPRRPVSARPVSARMSMPYSQLPRGLSIDEDHELLVTEDLDTDSLSGFDMVAESGIGAGSRPRSARPASARLSGNVPSKMPSRGRAINTIISSTSDRVVVVGTRAQDTRDSSEPVRPLSARSGSTSKTYATLDRGTHQNFNHTSTTPMETMTAASSGQRFTRYYFPLSDAGADSGKSSSSARPGGGSSARSKPAGTGHHRPASAPVKRQAYTGRPASATATTRPNEAAAARLPFYGHYDVVTAWDMDDPALDTTAWSPNLGYQRMQMAYIPFKNSTPSTMGRSVYQRPQSARYGAEGTTLKRLPSDPPPKDEEDLLWLKYSAREAEQAFDLQELAAWAVQLQPRGVQDMKPCFILMQGLLKDILQQKLRGYSGEMQEVLALVAAASSGAKKDLEDAKKEVEALLPQIPDNEGARARVSAAMESAAAKLEGAMGRVAEYSQSNRVEAVIEARRAAEDSWKREQQALKAEISSLSKMLLSTERENSELKTRSSAAASGHGTDNVIRGSPEAPAKKKQEQQKKQKQQQGEGWVEERRWEGLRSLALEGSGASCWASCGCGAVLRSDGGGFSEPSWRHVSSDGDDGAAAMRQVAASSNGKHVWGVDYRGGVHYRPGLGGCWRAAVSTSGHGLHHQEVLSVSVSAEGDHVWGVSTQGGALHRWGPSRPWQKVEGISGLKGISVSGDGKHVWAVNAKDQVFYRAAAGPVGSWRQVEGSLCQVAVSHDGGVVWGVSSSAVAFSRSGFDDVCWRKVDGEVHLVALSGDGRVVLGYNRETGTLYRREAADA